NCVKCGEAITSSRTGCTALEKNYHVDCFNCGKCGKQLAGLSFYSVDGKPFCEDDYLQTLEKCIICLKPISEKVCLYL
ncbi:unnamed protein product, partial [Soboliphyme baturini]|uniref:LIM zinc-binding domain-containing protein n=1 Tax=Soboliphyme baturini TaxID=241478 RepID=A0A183J252_9BILA